MDIEQFQNSVLGLTVEGTINSAWELYKQSQHALWMARAERAKDRSLVIWHLNNLKDVFNKIENKKAYDCFHKWKWVERKCLEKAKEFE